MTEYHSARRRRQWFRAIVGIVAMAMLVVGGVVGYRLVIAEPRRAEEQASVARGEQQLRAFTRAWQAGDWAAAGKLTDTPDRAASLLASVNRNLEPEDFRIEVGTGKADEGDKGSVVVPFTVRMKVPRVGAYAYDSKARIVETSGTRLVEFMSSMIHPALKPGQTLAVTKMSDRGSILDRNGEVLTAATLVGGVDERSGAGVSGLEKRYNEQLAGSGPAYAIAITDRNTGDALKPLQTAGTRAGKDVRTTIDPNVQRAAAAALEGAQTPASIVAIKPSTGDILAVANRPGGLNRALVGKYPPGSTFKVVTAAALLEAGLRPSDVLDCPRFEWVNGYRFANQNEFVLPKGATFRDAFARSCNTAFVRARNQLDDDTLAKTATAFGIGGAWDTGASSYDGSVPVNTNVNDKAAAMIGQGRNLASPLVMASVAATVKSGRFVQPRLVPEAVDHPYKAPRALAPKVVSDLRSMMRSVVTSGAGDALRDLPGRPHAKTGTAEYGAEVPPRTHAWMIGYQETSDLAWAVQLEDGGSGGADAGPIAAAFLRKLAGTGAPDPG
ncbi:penicillin-binding transpeptidase domain-containing protein [Actinopolymorpha alba]|uniref:penicillin-binding transpeptidase domain-containing protein n=1 Tax=Actinopolymorpha alba TaxID=533267 RepID=UPI00037723F9|nr:penicillin-binding transpeptidase domain-containing protein [Actinopolymorpha alba]